jgi:sulfite exporter TauE/SafE
MALWTAFVMGLVGSLHCVGMCGPIALSLPYQGRQKWIAAVNVLLYNFGRIATYALLGIIIGLFGRGFFLAGFQSYISIGLGVLLLLIAFFSVNVEGQLLKIPGFQKLNSWVQGQLGRLLRQKGSGKLFIIGSLNGLLPCGLVYMGIVGAVTTGEIVHSALYMASFGLGTFAPDDGDCPGGSIYQTGMAGKNAKAYPRISGSFCASLHIQRHEF